MDIASTLKSEIFRPLVTLVVPGTIASLPYLFVAIEYFDGLILFWKASPYPFIGLLFILVLAVGLVLEDIGSLIEELAWSSLIVRKEKNYLKEWNEYLKLFVKDEIVGQRYLRTILVRMKFELSMAPALFIFLFGFIWLNIKAKIMEPASCIWISLGIVALGLYILLESYLGAKVLMRTRRAIIEGVEAMKVNNDKQ